jgi:hypothetical protein
MKKRVVELEAENKQLKSNPKTTPGGVKTTPGRAKITPGGAKNKRDIKAEGKKGTPSDMGFVIKEGLDNTNKKQKKDDNS